MAARVTKTVEYLRHDFTQKELLALGSELAEAYQSLDQIDNEEAVIKAQIKERKTTVQQKVGSLSRNISARFDMQNVSCRLEYDCPNVGEVTYLREDDGLIAKIRPMTTAERQQELPLEQPVVAAPVEQSQAAVEEFFQTSAPPISATVSTHSPIVEYPQPEPEESRQTMLTMGDAKKRGKKRTSEEAQFDPTPIHPQPDHAEPFVATDLDLPDF
jgi:hypothetical protein